MTTAGRLARYACCWCGPAAFLLDMLTKRWALSALSVEPLVLWPGVLRLALVQNTGMAFGLLPGRQMLITVVTGLLLLSMLAFVVIRRRSLPPLPLLGLSMMLGGAVGNFTDRILRGYVIDFIEILLFPFPVFNVADSVIVLAFVLLAGHLLFGWGTMRDERNAA